MAEFFDLRIVSPTFESSLMNLILELDHLRRKTLAGTTPPITFFQLKSIFHMLESLASARIEGNNTTVAEYIETKIQHKPTEDYDLKEIENMEKCLEFIDRNIEDSEIDRLFVSELHKRVVGDLPPPPEGEGDISPGVYRTHDVKIKNSAHIPPEPTSVAPYMDDLFEFIKAGDEPKYDLLKIAIAHHRFVWIHPFGNGNGRTVRLFTYAMLAKYGFSVYKGRILNPVAVFCTDRNAYYDNLALADTGTDENMLVWCEYVLKGLKNEIEKIDRLLEYDFLKTKVLLPTISYALDRQFVTELEAKILKRAVEKKTIKAGDLSDLFKSKHISQRSRFVSQLKSRNMLISMPDNPRFYTISFFNNYLLRGIIEQLKKEGFVSTIP